MDKDKIKEGKGNRVLLIIIAIATLLVSVVGATFAYFTAQIGTVTEKEIVIRTGIMGTHFDGGNQINIANTYPKGSLADPIPEEPAGRNLGYTKEFTITLTGSAPAGTKSFYSLGMEVYKNTFDEGDLKYTLEYISHLDENDDPDDNGTPATDILLTSIPTNSSENTVTENLGTGNFEWGTDPFPDAGVSHTYHLNIYFPDQNKEQSQGKVFNAWVSIEENN